MAFIEDKCFVLQKHLPRGFETGKLKFFGTKLKREHGLSSVISQRQTIPLLITQKMIDAKGFSLLFIGLVYLL